MIFAYDLTGAQQIVRNIPLYGAGTNIKAGAAVIRGVTDGTNFGFGIIATGASNAFIGVTEALFAAATLDNDPAAGTKYILTPVTINPFAVYEAEYSQTTGLSVASTVASTSITVTSGENIGGGWILGVGAPGLGLLSFVKSSSSGTYTLKSSTFTYTTASKVIKIPQLYDDNLDLTVDATSILGTTAAQGTGLIRLHENKVVAPGFDHQFLDPTKHDNVTLPTGFKIFGMISFETSIYNASN